MSINAYNPQQGASNVANIPSGEGVLDTRKHVVLSFKNMTYSCDIMKNKCEGKVMLTNKRVIFLSNSTKSAIRDFSMPFSTIKNLELKQPMFGQNHIIGNVNAAPGGGWQGSAQFRLDFNHGGAIEFGQNVLKTASNPPVIAPVPTMVNPMTGDPFTMGGIYPPPPPSYSGVPPAGAGVYDPNTGFYTFPGASAPPPQNDAPPSYDELQESFQIHFDPLDGVVLD